MNTTDEPSITQARLKERLHYNPETGVFTWLKRGGGFKLHCGQPWRAGWISTAHGSPHRSINIDKRPYRAARLAVLYMTGRYPGDDEIVEHADDDTLNDAWKNLCVVPLTDHLIERQRQRGLRSNNSSGRRGVTYQKGKGLYRAQITVNGRNIELGASRSLDKAIAIREAAERGEHPKVRAIQGMFS